MRRALRKRRVFDFVPSYLKGKVEGHEAIILLDSGLSRDFIPVDFVHKHRISTENLGDQLTTTLADGRTSSTAQTCTVPLNLVLPNLREKVAFTVFPLTKYNVILGKPWLSANNPAVNFRMNEVQIGDDLPWIALVDSGSCTHKHPSTNWLCTPAAPSTWFYTPATLVNILSEHYLEFVHSSCPFPINQPINEYCVYRRVVRVGMSGEEVTTFPRPPTESMI